MKNRLSGLHAIGGAFFGIFGAFASFEYIDGQELSKCITTLGIGVLVPVIISSITFFVLRNKHTDENRTQ